LIIDFGVFREALLTFNFIFILVLLELTLVFLGQHTRSPESKVTYGLGLSFALVFFGSIFSFIHLFYVDETILIEMYDIFLAGSQFVFAHFLVSEFRRKKIVYRLYPVLMGIALICIIVIPYNWWIYTIIFGIVEIAFIIPLVVIMAIWKNNFGIIRRKMILAFIGYCLVMSGVGGTHQRMINIMVPLYSTEELGIIFIIFFLFMNIGLFFIQFGFNIDIFVETDWRKNLIEYYVVTLATGKQIDYRYFLSEEEKNESLTAISNQIKQYNDLFSRGITSFDVFLKQFTQKNKNLNVIYQDNKAFLIEKGKYLLSIFVVKKDLTILRFLLKKLNEEFEYYYSALLSEKIVDNQELFSSMTAIADNLLNKYNMGGKR
jgi:hypothetical protein